jgi:hypothetical protein
MLNQKEKNMNLKELSDFIRKNLAACIVSLLIFGAFGAFLVQQYIVLYEKKNELDQQVKAFYNESLIKQEEFLKREKEVYKQELSIKSEKETYAKKVLELDNLKIKYEKLNAELNESARVSSVEMRRQIAEEKLNSLMSEFSATGANLRTTPECNDKEGWKQYNIARAKLSEAISFARANGLYEDYEGFFDANSSFMMSTC